MPRPIYISESQLAPSEQHTSTATSKLSSQHTTTLQHLDDQYDTLTKIEQSIDKYLSELKQEEKALRLALDQSSTSLKTQMERDKIRKEQEAVARLEEVLMGGDADSSDESDDEKSGELLDDHEMKEMQENDSDEELQYVKKLEQHSQLDNAKLPNDSRNSDSECIGKVVQV